MYSVTRYIFVIFISELRKESLEMSTWQADWVACNGINGHKETATGAGKDYRGHSNRHIC
jgi:hypothetical protein